MRHERDASQPRTSWRWRSLLSCPMPHALDPMLLDALVLLNAAVAHVHDALGVSRDVRLVRDQHDRFPLVVQSLKDRHDLFRRARVEIAGGCIGENNCMSLH